jgi:hypothetical protein
LSEALTVIDNNQALAQGGVGLGSRLFKLKPSTIEIVQSTSRQDNVQYGKFRITATNEHFDEMKWVLLLMPQEQREYYDETKKNEFKHENKLCFSLDNLQPHARAKAPVAMNCANCPKGDINWATWRKTHNPSDLPPCRKYWHLVLADRATEMVHYFNVKGTSVSPFEQDMQNLARLIAQMQSNVKAQNKVITAENAKLAEGEPKKPLLADPNIFDITFNVRVEKSKAGPFVLRCEKFVQVRPEDRAEFGNLYLDFVSRRADSAEMQIASEQEAEANTAVSEPAPAPAGVVTELPSSGPIVGQVVGKDEPITI